MYVYVYACIPIVPTVSIVVPLFGLTTFSFRILKRKGNTVENIGNSDFRQQSYDLFKRDVLLTIYADDIGCFFSEVCLTFRKKFVLPHSPLCRLDWRV